LYILGAPILGLDVFLTVHRELTTITLQQHIQTDVWL